MSRLAAALLLLGTALAPAAQAAQDAADDAEPAAVTTRMSLELWGSLNRQSWVDGPMNPGNRLARLPEQQRSAEARLNLSLKSKDADLLLEPRGVWQRTRNGFGAQSPDEAFLNQAYARLRLDDAWSVTAGRERFTWGPANWRSPSHPFYFDAGRSQPLREITGVDLTRLSYSAGRFGASLAHVFGDGHAGAVPAEGTTLAKFDWRGSDWLASGIASRQPDGSPFFGGFAQATPADAWLVYAEVGHGRQAGTSPLPAQRGSTALLGASYTLEEGQSLLLEYLTNDHVPASRRDTLSLLWQSNPQDSALYWRLNTTANLHDRSVQTSLLVEKNIAAQWSVFALAVRNSGGATSEFASYVRSSLTLGIKLFAF